MQYLNLQIFQEKLLDLLNNKNIKFFIPDPSFGHIATNAPIVLSKAHEISVEYAFKDICKDLSSLDYIDRIELVKGFCNIWLKPEYIIDTIIRINHDKHSFGYANIGNQDKVNIEYISANPTGPMHLGHLRGLYGDALANLMEFFNYNVTREFYINDVGNQVRILGESLRHQYCVFNKIKCDHPEEFYPGKEIAEIAASLERGIDINNKSFFENTAIARMLELIKEDLNLLNVRFDKWVSEEELCKRDPSNIAVNLLEDKGYIKEDVLGEITGKRGVASNMPIKIFNNDKAITKANGEHTYFGGDLRYLYNKMSRGFDLLIYCVGSDQGNHFDYLAKAGKILNSSCNIKIISFQSVDMIIDGKHLKFSKRGGIAIRPSELNLPHIDILRLMILSKNNDTHFSINIDEMKEESISNMFYYIQYAYARSRSILYNQIIDHNEYPKIQHYTQSMKDLAYLLAQYPIELRLALGSINLITNYVEKICKKFHSIWNEGIENKESRWIIMDSHATNSRLKLAKAFKIVMQSALKILGVRAINMNNHTYNIK